MRGQEKGEEHWLVKLDFQYVVCQMTAVYHTNIREAQGMEMHAAAVQKSQLLAAITISVVVTIHGSLVVVVIVLIVF